MIFPNGSWNISPGDEGLAQVNYQVPPNFPFSEKQVEWLGS